MICELLNTHDDARLSALFADECQRRSIAAYNTAKRCVTDNGAAQHGKLVHKYSQRVLFWRAAAKNWE